MPAIRGYSALGRVVVRAAIVKRARSGLRVSHGEHDVLEDNVFRRLGAGLQLNFEYGSLLQLPAQVDAKVLGFLRVFINNGLIPGRTLEPHVEIEPIAHIDCDYRSALAPAQLRYARLIVDVYRGYPPAGITGQRAGHKRLSPGESDPATPAATQPWLTGNGSNMTAEYSWHSRNRPSCDGLGPSRERLPTTRPEIEVKGGGRARAGDY
jgi:hypothetical protein